MYTCKIACLGETENKENYTVEVGEVWPATDWLGTCS